MVGKPDWRLGSGHEDGGFSPPPHLLPLQLGSPSSQVSLVLLVSPVLLFRCLKDETVARMHGGVGQVENRK